MLKEGKSVVATISGGGSATFEAGSLDMEEKENIGGVTSGDVLSTR